MALTKSSAMVTLLGSTALTPGNSVNSASISIGYGCSIIANVTNGATGPTIGCSCMLQVSADNTTWLGTDDQRTAATTANGSTFFCFNLGVGGNDNGDWNYARIAFSGNTAQNVTVQAHASATSAI